MWFRFCGGRTNERGCSKLGNAGGNLRGVSDLLVPLECRCLIDEGGPLGEGGIGPLGDVQVVDHLTCGASGAIASDAMGGDTESHGWVGLIDGRHHVGTHVDEGTG